MANFDIPTFHSSPAEYVLSEKGKKKLIDSGHVYVRDRGKGEKVFWRCEKSAMFKCSARVHSDNDVVVKQIGEHNHVADAATVAALRIVDEVKKRAAHSQDEPHKIIADVTVGISSAALAKMPANSLLKRTIQRVRKRKGAPLPNPASHRELIISEDLTPKETEEPFLLFDSENLKAKKSKRIETLKMS